MTEKLMRVRFAPSPTGNVHIGNIRVAIFNWLMARHRGGQFILRIEDTDLERSTPEAIAKMQAAMQWLGLNYDEPPLYQTARRSAHDAAIQKMLADRHAFRRDANSPVILRVAAPLFSDSFVSAPRATVTIDFSAGELTAHQHSLFYTVKSPRTGEIFVTPFNWDTLAEPRFILADGAEISALAMRDNLPESAEPLPIAPQVSALKFQRRYVFFDDLVLGRCEKPLDSLRDFTLARADGSPVFHTANVVDDIFQNITHILRGNDHVENTFRHLFLFRALGAEPPQYGHFPMIVNQSGKPYSKRDGDAYVGDFQQKGFLADAMFNYLALCGWSPGDDREMLTREQLTAAFTVDRVSKAAAQFDSKKLTWMNQQYLQKLPECDFIAALKNAAAEKGIAVENYAENWWQILAATQRERLEKFGDFLARCRYFFDDNFAFDPKAVKKHWLANQRAGVKVLRDLREIFGEISEWTVEALAETTHRYAEKIAPAGEAPAMGAVAQPLRVALSGTAATPGIGETLFLIGRASTLTRLDRAVRESDNFTG